MRRRLEKEEEVLTKRINNLKEGDPFSDPDHVIDNAAVDTDVREQIGHETVEAQILALEKKINDIQNALKKMNKGKYGLCESCRKLIPSARLKLLPEAKYCIECEKRLVK